MRDRSTHPASTATVSKRTPFVLAGVLALYSVPLSGARAEPAEEATEEVLVVTGSRIKRSIFSSAAPVQVISRQELEFSGATNLADVVQHLSVAQGSGWDGSIGTPGTVSINLRGLGPGATLVLLNGRRLPPSGAGADVYFSDISTIPLAAIERIEILRGGASAIYGSDAVAGVVNLITRRDWEGLRVEADAATTDRLDRKELTASAALGATSERARVSVALAYTRDGALLANEREWTAGADRETYPGYPGSFLRGFNQVPDPDCERAPDARVTDGLCQIDGRRFIGLIGAVERVTFYGHAAHDLSDHAEVFVELGAARSRAVADFLPSLPIPPPFPVVPADHVDNPFMGAARFVGGPLGAESGGQRTTLDDDSLRGALGLRGDLGGIASGSMFEDWQWELFASAGASRFRSENPDTLRDAFQEALDSCSDRRDLRGCYNPFYSAVLGTGTPNSQSVIDSFSATMTTQTDYLMHSYNAGISGALLELPGGDAAFAAGGELRHERRETNFDHDADTLRYAFLIGNTDAAASRQVHGAYLELRWPVYDGVELQTAGRLESYTDTAAVALSPTAGITLRPAEVVGAEHVTQELRLLSLRAQVTQAFRAPSVYQSFPGFAVVPGLYNLPDSPLPLFVPVQSFGNPDLEPERALAMSVGLDWAPRPWLALSADYWQYDYEDRIGLENAEQVLRRELAAREQPDYVADPRVVPGTDCDILQGPCIERIVVKQQNQGDVFTSGIDFGLLLTISGATFGGAEDDFGTVRLGTQGSYTLAYEIPRAAQAPLEDRNGNPLLDDDGEPVLPGDCDAQRCDVVGKRNWANIAPPLPALRLSLPLSWQHAGHSASFSGHYIGGFDDDSFGLDREGRLRAIDAVLTLDAQYGYTLRDVVGDALSLYVGVRNLTDRAPPAVRAGGSEPQGFIRDVHDPRGRMVYVKLVQEL